MYVDLKLKKIGGSIFGRFPSDVVKQEKLHPEDIVRVNITSKKKRKVPTIEELFGTFKSGEPTQKIKDELREGWGD